MESLKLMQNACRLFIFYVLVQQK